MSPPVLAGGDRQSLSPTGRYVLWKKPLINCYAMFFKQITIFCQKIILLVMLTMIPYDVVKNLTKATHVSFFSPVL
jgi:hypothetical protein